jgi:hypothetical protein
MQQALGDELAGLGARRTDPDGGFFLWLTLPAGLDSRALFPLALAQDVAFIPGATFSPAGHFASSLRLASSAGPPDRTRAGIKRLGRASDRYLAAGPGGQASRRISTTAVTVSRMAARTTKAPVSMPWNAQNRLAG